MPRSTLGPVLAGVIMVAFATPGCVGPVPSAPTVADVGVALFVRNETDRQVVILVDGEEVLRVVAGERIRDRLVLLPARPSYTIEARTAAGYVLGSFATNDKAGFVQPGFAKNTACGNIYVWINEDFSLELAPLRPEDQEPCE